jgi:hypothetical protein
VLGTVWGSPPLAGSPANGVWRVCLLVQLHQGSQSDTTNDSRALSFHRFYAPPCICMTAAMPLAVPGKHLSNPPQALDGWIGLVSMILCIVVSPAYT